MGSLLEVLAAVCREAPLREKVVVVPSLAVGHQIGDALARSGTAWVNLRFETTRTIADAIAGFEIAREGWTVLSRAQALAILERACDRVLDEQSYFAQLRGRPGLYRAIQRSVDDLRHAGLRELPGAAFEDPRKARDLSSILAAYEEELTDRRFVDRFGVLARAIALLESGASSPYSDARFVVADGLEVSASESRLIHLVAGEAALIRSPQNGRGEDASVRFVRAVGEENEIRYALRHAQPFDDAEIVYTTRDPYLALAYELTAEHAIPATFAEGISASYTRPGQAALGFLHWIASDFETAHLQKIARAGAIDTKSDALTPFAFGRVLREAMIGWRRERYGPRIEALVVRLEGSLAETDSEARIAGLQRRIARARAALELVNALLEITASVAEGDDVDAGDLARATLGFLDRFAATRNEIDGMALAALRRMLRELTRLPEARAARALSIERLAEAVEDVYVAASNPRPGHLHVAPVRSGGWSGRSSIFIAGLDDAKHPGSGLQDPIVLDRERDALNEAIRPRGLDLLGDAPARASARLVALLDRVRRRPGADASPQVTLSWTGIELRERRAGFPSRDVLEVYRNVRSSAATYEQLAAEATPAGFLEPSVPVSLSEWSLAERFVRNVRREREVPPSKAARESDAITEYDGRVHVRPAEIDPRLTGRVYSASQLERMARCPFGWFLERVLKIEPLEELERIQDQWLDPRQFGTLVHEVLELAMTEICHPERSAEREVEGSPASEGGDPSTPLRSAQEDRRASLERHLPRMREIAEARLAWWRDEVPPGTETAYARQREELLVTCEIFLRTEEQHASRVAPMFFELGFGGPEDPFAIPLGGGREVRLRGSIDRVDRDTTTGQWEVWDYKTGSLFEYRDRWDLKQGTKLQHVIYARALEHVLRRRGLEGSVQCAGYYFPTAKGAGAREARKCAAGELEKALNHLFDVVGSGFFPQPDEGRCSFCPYPDVCGDQAEVEERMRRKQSANGEDPAVRAWRDLQRIG